MKDAKEPEAKKKSLKDSSFALTDSVSRLVRATSGAAAEAVVGSVRVTTGFVTDVTKTAADSLTTAVEESTKVARQTVDKFFTTLDSGSGDSGGRESDEESTSGSTHEAKKAI